MLQRWARVATGRSYWHQSQALGRSFEPEKLRGYFNDLTGKTSWGGHVDEAGIPLTVSIDGSLFAFPTAIFQKALGHWDQWLDGGSELDWEQFLLAARWAVENQDASGGWAVWPLLGIEYRSDYSAMTQGEGVSLLARAFHITGEAQFLDGARSALECMVRPVVQGGTARARVPGELVLEEVPDSSSHAILNGWIFAIYGLYDYLLVESSDFAATHLADTIQTLTQYLLKYDRGFWSNYDAVGTIASPFYQDLHIAQLEALAKTFPAYAGRFEALRTKFHLQRGRRINLYRAVALKIAQKLRNPPIAVLR